MDKPHKLTHAEHQTRAMLLGRRYSQWAHAYVNTRDELPWLNADTLEHMDAAEVLNRISRILDKDPHADLGLAWSTNNEE